MYIFFYIKQSSRELWPFGLTLFTLINITVHYWLIVVHYDTIFYWKMHNED